jgi:hypothetical protein
LKTAQLINILHHFSGSTVEDAEAVVKLKNAYPFSQLLHALSARVSQDHGFTNSKSELQLAAVYAADRGVLKEIMELEFNTGTDSLEILAVHHQKGAHNATKPDVAEQVLFDLERLHQLKHNFEMMYVDGQAEPVHSVAHAEAEDVLSSRTKKERIRELAKSYIPVTPVTESNEDTPRPARRLKKKEPVDTLINDLELKQELTPESEKHKEQLEIIEHFIKIQPSIVNLKDKESHLNDFDTIKTGEFGDNIISETLVEILLKQGKKEKAVEVLKKLIWKFPQKKAYFAAQIEELRK